MIFLSPPRTRELLHIIGKTLMADLGLTHIALPVTNPEVSVAFYSKYA